MVLLNYSTKELTAKVVYYGPGLCGKTTNLHWIHEKLPIKNKGKMLSLATETDRTLFFDFLPIELGTIRGMRTRIQLYTVPGQVFYNATRRMVLKGADCVVFVCDSQEPILEANLESLENLRQNLEANEIDPDDIPIVLQYNKRDLPNALPIEILGERLNDRDLPFYEAVAVRGIGVEETLKGATALVFRSLSTKYGGPATSEAPAAPEAGSAFEETPAPVALAPAAPPAPTPLPSPRVAEPPPPILHQGEAETLEEVSVEEEVPIEDDVSIEDEDFLEGLELQPTSDTIDDDETRAGSDSEPLVVEEAELTFAKAEAVEPFEEEEFLLEGSVAKKVGVDTQARGPDEAAELRRRIGDEAEHGEDLGGIVGEEADLSDQEEEDIPMESPAPENWSADVKVGEATLISFEDALMREALKKYSQSPPPAAPPIVDVGTGTVDVTVPVDVEVRDGVAQVQVTLRLTLNVKRQR